MKSVYSRLVFGIISALFVVILGAASANAAHTIAGGVFDTNRMPVADVDVELLDQYYRTIDRQKTGSSGRYEFSVVTQGRYTVRVYAFRLDFQDQSQDIEVSAVTAVPGQAGSSYNNLDFYLQPRKGGMMDAELSVIFAQEIPSAAKKSYETAVKDFAIKRTADGIMGLNEALRILPTYYLALNRMGKELFLQGRYEEAVPFRLKAAEVTDKSSTALYYLGSSFFHLGKQFNKAALTSLSHAALLAPASPQIHYVLGKVQRAEGQFVEAEKSLVKAKNLTATSIPEIHMELAQIYADELKKYVEAADELEAYMKSSKQKGADQEKTKSVIANLRAKAKASPKN